MTSDEINQSSEKISLWQQIKEDFSVPKLNDPALDSSFELFFNYPGVWAIINHRVANRLYNKGWKKLARALVGITSIFTKTDIHPAATIGRRVFIDHAIGVVIGATAIVEDDVLIYQGVTLGGVSLDKGKRHPTIKSNVVIGSGAKVLGNITIGANCKIGANSVVVCDVPDNSTAVGVPAKIIRRDNKNCKMAHGDLPDINKEMFKYLLERIHVVEVALKEEDGIDVSEKDKKLEAEYNNFIEAMNSIKKKEA
ncbi:serine O-acetyltransferase [Arcobacter cloacae]|uniref:serine O-acetyltransferase n=1 Tax=Arcobacter cloacae TaxID=1054034 RepID=A0A4Q0ZNP4_9BACT|nr:serine O-acetyltransferase [Arcobacter cloacae]QKF89574.1 serine O-acetyltransferase [Arcobacter cloacae]RXI42811.1 serine O-acetyltransferase [Arcobacter cloacae]RXJ85376.1 serine O-acetyltransferase [Arcobacter cloacae]